MNGLKSKETLSIPKEVLVELLEKYVRTITGHSNIVLCNNDVKFSNNSAGGNQIRLDVKDIHITWDNSYKPDA